MSPLAAAPDELAALIGGRAAIDLSGSRVVQVLGADARPWLHDLVTADVAHLPPGSSRRSLLLDATGHIRADLWVVADDRGCWLVQASEQARPIGEALAPYVLSSDVRLLDRGDDVAPIALPDGPGDAEPDAHAGDPGRVVLAPASDPRSAPDGRTWVTRRAAEVLRILRGDPRMTVDFDETAVPAAAGLERLIDLEKGCFLGQESVARVRNLGHPPTVIRHLRSDGPVEPGEPLVAPDRGDEVVGRVTSAAVDAPGGTVMLVTVRWSASTMSLRTAGGMPLVPVGSSD